MPSFDEREHLVKEFRTNTGASDSHAREILLRNRWNLADSYKEVEQQICVGSSNRQSSGPIPTVRPPPYPHQEAGRGGMEGGLGLATQGVRNPARGRPVLAKDTGPQLRSMEGLKVALPPVKAPEERIIPIQVEGRTLYQTQSTANTAPSNAVARMTLDNKVLPSQPGMVSPKITTNTIAATTTTTTSSSNKAQSQSAAPTHSHDTYPRLKRGFSSITENEVLVNAARCSVLQEIKEDNHCHMFQTFMLPDFSLHPDDFRAFLVKELIEASTLTSLQAAGRLNWWALQGLCQRLLPMATSGDGNCLLHAASLSMWGIHDRLLTLRNALHDTLTSATYRDNLYRRWRWQQTQVNLQSSLVFSEEEWRTEWDNILRLASPSPRSAPESSVNTNSCCDSPLTSSSTEAVVYESLEEFHVFVLAHVLQRPIIVVADTILRDANGDALAPIPFGGIYLPLERPRDHCCLSPLLLTYDAAHFSALVPMQLSKEGPDSSLPLAIPVVDPDLQLLPLHFCHDPGPKYDWKAGSNKDQARESCLPDRLNLLKAYLDIVYLTADPALIPTPALAPAPAPGGHPEEKRKEGKPTTVAKQFGSLGKHMGKKFKTLSNNLAPGKPGVKGQDGQLVSLGGGLSHSTKFITALATTGGEGGGEGVVACAKLDCRNEDTHDVFIHNYLKDAQARFQRAQETRQGEDPQQRSLGGGGSNNSRGREDPRSSRLMLERGLCHTLGCSQPALPALAVCDRCASQQQWTQAGGTLDRSRGGRSQSQPAGYNTFPGRQKAPTGLPPSAPTEEVVKCGKSKFYTPAQSHPQPASLQALRQEDRHQSLSTGNVTRRPPASRPRSPSPDYDNVPRAAGANPKCATVGCDFYGSRETGNLCSSCYRSKALQPQLARPEKSTKL